MKLSPGELATLTEELRGRAELDLKRDIQLPSRVLGSSTRSAWFPSREPILNGDDTAVLPSEHGYVLFAAEGMRPELVAADPWFAGFCSVMVNLSDIAAMGAQAEAWLEARVQRRGAGERLAVIFDIDETMLSNLEEMTGVDFGYVPPIWDAWVLEGRAPAIEPMVAGPSARKKARTSSSSLIGAKRGRPPWVARSPASRKYCRKPEIRTPQAAAWPGVGKNTATASVAIMEILRRMEAAAALAKRCITLRMPP